MLIENRSIKNDYLSSPLTHVLPTLTNAAFYSLIAKCLTTVSALSAAYLGACNYIFSLPISYICEEIIGNDTTAKKIVNFILKTAIPLLLSAAFLQAIHIPITLQECFTITVINYAILTVVVGSLVFAAHQLGIISFNDDLNDRQI